MNIDREQLKRVAIACRSGLMGLSANEYSVFHGFPKAACGPASEILGRLLKEELGYDGVYVCGQDHPYLGQEQSHAWFEVGEFLIDITHDQFEGSGLCGWVFERGNEWHTLFNDRDVSSGYCTQSNWSCYPDDGYQAALAEFQKGSQ